MKYSMLNVLIFIIVFPISLQHSKYIFVESEVNFVIQFSKNFQITLEIYNIKLLFISEKTDNKP